jgi:hypothetical protein
VQENRKFRVKVAGITLACMLAGAGIAGAASPAASLIGFARHGADDPAGHVRGGGADDPVGHARRGADDPAGHVRGGGADDPVGHARRGVDDLAGDNRGVDPSPHA